MPLYKFVGNIILTKFENLSLYSNLSEFHSGYRMYATDTLKKLHFERYTDDFHFDTQILIEMIHRGERIIEIPIPTYYGGEICYVNGFKYAFNVLKSVLKYKLFSSGLSNCEWISPPSSTRYAPKKSSLGSHKRIAHLVPEKSKALDLGAEGNYIEELKEKGCEVWGITKSDLSREVAEKYDKLIRFDLESGPLSAVLGKETFDVAIMADVLEHIRNANMVASEIKDLLNPNGFVIASTPNIAHFFVRLNLLAGRFPYGRRGILDESHIHFYTVKSFKHLLTKEGYDIFRRIYTPIPLELFAGKSKFSQFFFKFMEYVYYLSVKIYPGLFAYQMLFCLRAKPKKPEAYTIS